MGNTLIKKKKPPASILYRVVYSSRYVYGTVFVLLCSLLLQPIARTYAAEQQVSEVEIDAEIVPDVPWTETMIDTSLVLPSENQQGQVAEVATAAESLFLDSPSDETDTPVAATNLSEVGDADLVDTSSIEVLSDQLQDDSTYNMLSPDDGTLVDQLSTSTNTEAISSSTPLAVSVSYDAATFQFGQDACVQIADGSFYCQQPVPTPSNTQRADGLYALPDKDGDLEIYLQQAGELIQITQNVVDDASPYFDQTSNTIVWHRLLNDRYQIIEYDIDTATERQVTSGTVNNMEPFRAGKYTAWQYWGTAWDIVLSDGQSIIRLTESDTHDISPSIRNGLVIWQRMHKDGTKTIELYDIKTGEYHTISDTEGGSISNPRMVVVYESTNSAGDVVTRGYDIITGEVSTIGTLPNSLPDDIPKPNDTGETVALVHAKTGAKDDQEERDVDVDLPESDTSTVIVSEFDLVIDSPNIVDVYSSSTQSEYNSLSTQDLTLDLTANNVTSAEVDITEQTLDDKFTLVIQPSTSSHAGE